MNKKIVNVGAVFGFLGAGKTTFIKSRLRSNPGRTAVIVNEFGDLGLDGEDIQSEKPLKVVEMPGGCICCTLSQNIAETIDRLVEQEAPDYLLIEPSGVAEASSVLTALTGVSSPINLEYVVTIVDASTFLEDVRPKTFGNFFMDQLVHADVVLVNKTDLISSEILDKITLSISSINPSALSFPVQFGRWDADFKAGERKPLKKTKAHAHLHEIDTYGRKFDFIWPDDPFNELMQVISNNELGHVLRAKGVFTRSDGVKTMLQYARGDISLTPTPLRSDDRITIIGQNIDRNAFDFFFCGLEPHSIQK